MSGHYKIVTRHNEAEYRFGNHVLDENEENKEGVEEKYTTYVNFPTD